MPLTEEQNERLTRVGPGTPMGNLFRYYWQPVGTVQELESDPVQPIRLFGEDLTLFRSESGVYGLIGDRCPHRGVSFEYGIPDERGLRCAYHGWLFDETGQCLDQPFEETNKPEARFKDSICAKSYPVEALGELIFAYLGPQPAPLLPKWDLLVRPDLDAVVEIHDLPCNWLQCVDNAADPVHVEYLHGYFGNYQMRKLGRPPVMDPQKTLKIAFNEFKYGIMKHRLYEGEDEATADGWTIGHPLIFPNILSVGSEGRASLQIRVPIDDVNTRQYVYRTLKRPDDAEKKPTVIVRAPLFDESGHIVPGMQFDNMPSQDMLAWVASGQTMDRRNENLATSDQGVLLYHWMLNQQMDCVERGEEPIAVIRDPAENEPWINIEREIGYGLAHEKTIPEDQRYPDHFDRVKAAASLA